LPRLPSEGVTTARKIYGFPDQLDRMTSPFEQGKTRAALEKEAIHHTLIEAYRILDFYELDRQNYLRVDGQGLRFVPERYLEECRGLAEGSGISYDEIVALNFSPAIMRLYSQECTAFAVPKECSTEGSTLLLKNRDLGLRRTHPQVLCYSRLDSQNEFLGITDAGNVIWYQGVNQNGLVAFNTATPAQVMDPTRAQGMSTGILIRRILEECGDVNEAVRFIQTSSQSAGSNMFLGDPEKAVIVEVKPSLEPYVWRIEKPVCRANHYVFHVNPEPKNNDELMVRLSTLTRFERGKQLLQGETKISVEDLQQFSRDYNNGPGDSSICRHTSLLGNATRKLVSSQTLSGQIFKTGNKIETFNALGRPCQMQYVKVEFGEPVPSELSSGKAWIQNHRAKH